MGRKDPKGNSTRDAKQIDFNGRVITQISAGNNHVLALERDAGIVFSWGQNEFGQLGIGNREDRETPAQVLMNNNISEKVVQIYAGGNCSFAVTECGNLFSWGENRKGQLLVTGGIFYETPNLISYTLWDVTKGRIVIGKDGSGFIYSIGSNYEDDIDV